MCYENRGVRAFLVLAAHVMRGGCVEDAALLVPHRYQRTYFLVRLRILGT